jgi:putative transposase
VRAGEGVQVWLLRVVGRPVSATGRRRELLAEKVRALFAVFDGTYGYRRIHAELVRAGEQDGAELVRALMGDLDLVTVQPRPLRTTTEPRPARPRQRRPGAPRRHR